MNFDLLIVGGGMVGAALACGCAETGLSIGLVETRAPQRSWPAGEIDLRVSALSRASQRLLQQLGAWARIRELGASPYRKMRVWDGVYGGEIQFDSADLGEPDLGHIVENRVTQLALWEQLERHPAVRILCPAQGAELRRSPSGFQLQLNDGRQLNARLLVGADGRDSWVRKQAGIEVQGWAYDQEAIVANVEVSRSHEETAWQRFLPTGPLAFLPLQDGRCSIVWSVKTARARALMELEEAAFRQALQKAMESRLGTIGAIGPRAAFSLRLQQAKHYVQPHLALVGDAAHAVHPLAGQGVNLGFLDVAALIEALHFALAKGRDIGGLWALRRYERARRGENIQMLAAMDVFNRLFSNRIPPLALARSLGLRAVDRCPPLKQHFMRHALGLGAKLPPMGTAH